MADIVENPLTRNAGIYQLLVESSQKINLHSDAIALSECLGSIATFAASNHSGRFADGALDNPLFEMGLCLERRVGSRSRGLADCQAPKKYASRRCVLHVATMVMPTGGHTRTIENWMMNDSESNHSLFLTNQSNIPIRAALVSALSSQRGALIQAPTKANDLEKALQLRRCAQRSADMVILHHGSGDVVPVIAFATADSPPVAILNHADHLFWLGSGVADAIVNLRGMGAALSRDRRASKRDWIVPIPLEESELLIEKKKARTELGIDQNCTVYMTVGRSNKYNPTRHLDFFRTTTRILDSAENSILLVVGPNAEEVQSRIPRRLQDRIIFFGPITSTAICRAAADVYLEGFPFGSHTAALEAGRAGLPLILAYETATPLLATSSEWIDEVVSRPATESSYVEQAVQLAMSPQERKRVGDAIRDRITAWHCGDGWRTRVEAIYRQMEHLTHCPTKILHTEMKEDPIDVATARWHSETNSECIASDPHEYVLNWIQGFAYHLRNRGLYSASAKLLLHATHGSKPSPAIIKQFFKLAPHWAARHLGLI